MPRIVLCSTALATVLVAIVVALSGRGTARSTEKLSDLQTPTTQHRTALRPTDTDRDFFALDAEGESIEAGSVDRAGPLELTELKGAVTTPAGEPVSDATVTVIGEGSGATRAVPTDCRGKYRCEVPANGDVWSVTATHSSLGSATRHCVPGGESCDLELGLGFQIQGSVSWSDDRAPVPGAEVTVTSLTERASTDRRILVDDRGGFHFAGLPAGSYQAIVRGVGVGQFAQEFSVGRTRTPALRLLVDPARMTRGLVTDSADRPVVGAQVVVTYPGSDRRRADTTDITGAFAIDALGSQEVTVEVLALGHARWTLTGTLDPDEVLDVRLEPGLELAGQIVDQRTGSPIPFALVHCLCGERGSSARADERGQFMIPGLKEGVWDITITARGHVTLATALHLDASSSSRRFSLQQGVELRGRVVDRDGAAIEGVMVQLVSGDEPHAARSGARGRFAVGGLEQRDYICVFTHSSFSRLSAEIEPSAAETVFTLTPGGTLSGRVEREGGGQVTGTVMVEQVDGNTLVRATIGRRGRYSTEHLPAGDYRLWIRGSRTHTSTVRVEEGLEIERDLIVRR